MKAVAIALMIFLMAFPCHSEEQKKEEKISEQDLFQDASDKYGIPKNLLIAIARQESSMNPLCINIAGQDFYPKNEIQALDYIRRAQIGKRSFDVGIMQINNYWHKELNIPAEDLLDPFTNIDTGAKILAMEIKRYGFNWQAVGKYHSPNLERGRNYAWKVFNRMRGIYGQTEIVRNRKAQPTYNHTPYSAGIWRSANVQPKGRVITFGLREKDSVRDENREHGKQRSNDGTATNER